MPSIDAVKEYSRSSAERLLAVDERPEETVPNSLILINNIMYYICLIIKSKVSKYSNNCIKYSKTSIHIFNKKYGIHINKKVTH